MGDGPQPDPPSTRGNTYRRIGVRACRRLHTVPKLTSANGSRFTFLYPAELKCKISRQPGERVGVGGRVGVPTGGGSNTQLRLQVPDVRFEEEGEHTVSGSKTFRISTHARLPVKTNQNASPTPTPIRSPPADTSSRRRHVTYPADRTKMPHVESHGRTRS
jgi:hypothetical protein